MINIKQAGAGSIILAFVVVCIAGFLLFHFNDTINTERTEALANADSGNILENILLHALMPLIWGGYLFFSYLLLTGAVRLPGL